MAARLAVAAPGYAEPVAAASAAGRVLDARHWPPAGARMVDDGARTAALDQREQSLRQRELELAEQRRVLAEEYRLIRSQRAVAEAPRVLDDRHSATGACPGRQYHVVCHRPHGRFLGTGQTGYAWWVPTDRRKELTDG